MPAGCGPVDNQPKIWLVEIHPDFKSEVVAAFKEMHH